ncbi:hypothetical protein [Pseudanabaena minima]
MNSATISNWECSAQNLQHSPKIPNLPKRSPFTDNPQTAGINHR